MVAGALAGGLLVLLKWWLDNKMPHTPKEMNAYFQALVMAGVREALKQR